MLTQNIVVLIQIQHSYHMTSSHCLFLPPISFHKNAAYKSSHLSKAIQAVTSPQKTKPITSISHLCYILHTTKCRRRLDANSPQRQGDPDVHQRLSKQERISHSELTVASHIFCLTESKVGYWFIQLG